MPAPTSKTGAAPCRVSIEKMIPDAAYTSVTVTAFETDPTLRIWAITAIASCATAPVGLVWTFVQSPVNSLDKGVTATCPAGTTLLGGGAQVKNGLGNVIIDEIKPDGNVGVAGTEITVEANEDAVYGGQWSVTAAASCAAPIPGQQAIWLNSAYDAKSYKDIETPCPAGQVLTGGAAEVGTFLPGEAVIVGTFPVSPSPGSPPTSIKVYGAEEDPITPPDAWAMTAKAICADQ
jgi:hypothetical protein